MYSGNSLGSLDENSSEQVLNAMIGVLNANHDDHDFGNSKPVQFKALTQSECMKTVNKQLGFYKEHGNCYDTSNRMIDFISLYSYYSIFPIYMKMPNF